MSKITFNWYVYDSTDDNEWLISLLTGMYMMQSLLLFACLELTNLEFVIYLWQVGGLLRVLRYPPPIKRTDTT